MATISAAEPILRVNDVSVSFGGVRALSRVSMSVGDGEIRGIIGPNGAGKTTLIDAISGFEAIAGGQISYLGEHIERWTAPRRSRAGIIRTFQNLELFHDLSVEANLRVAARRGRKEEGAQPTIAEIAVLCRLDGVMDTEVQELSHGEQRMVSVGRAMAINPRLLVLDEPAVGVDRGTVGKMMAALKSWSKRCAIVIVEHDISVIRDVCHTITVLHLGSVLMDGDTTEVLASAELRDIYLGRLES